jgi:mannosyltransferase
MIVASKHERQGGAAQPELFVTNFNRNHTGVSTTANAVVERQNELMAMRLVGYPLPRGPDPVSFWQALRLSRTPPTKRPFVIWHVRRNNEMLAAIFARDVLRLPLRIVFTSAAQRLHSCFPRKLIARMDAVICTTNKAATFVSKVAAVVPHGIDVNRFVPAGDRATAWRRTGFPGRDGIGIVGRVRSEKGTDLFIEAMARLLPSRPDATAVVMGRWKAQHAGFQRALVEKTRTTGIQERVIFTGEVSADRMPSILQGLALLVAPPRYEGFGITPLEAMACGVPVVASHTGAFAEMIEEGVTGHIVPIGDVEALTSAIAAVLNDSVARQRMGALARERVVKLFSSDREVAEIEKVYERLWQREGFSTERTGVDFSRDPNKSIS